MDSKFYFMIFPTLYCICFLCVAYLALFRERYDLFYSLDQVKMANMSSNERRKILMRKSLIYAVIGILMFITSWNTF